MYNAKPFNEEEQIAITAHMKAFWLRMVLDQAENQYCQASCFLADYMAEIGFFHDYGDGIYAIAEKGQYWTTHPFNGADPFECMATDLLGSTLAWADRVIAECLKQDEN